MRRIKSGLRTIAALIVGVGFLWPSVPDVVAQRRPPNIVVIVSDDMGYADIGIHGGKDIPTPNIDALAKSGRPFHRRAMSPARIAARRAPA